MANGPVWTMSLKQRFKTFIINTVFPELADYVDQQVDMSQDDVKEFRRDMKASQAKMSTYYDAFKNIERYLQDFYDTQSRLIENNMVVHEALVKSGILIPAENLLTYDDNGIKKHYNVMQVLLQEGEPEIIETDIEEDGE